MLSELSVEPILVQRQAPLGWIVINRPAARNALTNSMWEALAQAVRSLTQDPQIRVILLRGVGDKSFIAGADIAELHAQLTHPGPTAAGYDFTLPLLEALSSAPQPVIAMINGHCFGGGVLIALACDVRIAGAQAQFGISAAKLGVAYPPIQGVARLVSAVGITHAADMLLSGRTINANEALRIGLVNQVTAPQELERTTRDYAISLAQNAPLVLAAHKLAIQEAVKQQPAAALLEDAVRQCYQSQDGREGLAAFLEKRPAKFAGR